MQKHVGKTTARFKHELAPEKFTYALGSYTAERRSAGWFICKTVTNFGGEKPKWSGTSRTRASRSPGSSPPSWPTATPARSKATN
jgi:hypothetical protein